MSTTKWALDPSHSEVSFKIKHMMISNVTGHFGAFNVTAETEGDDFSKSKVSFTADVNSINTKSEQRDGHLKSGDFFDAEKYPHIKFEATKMNKVSDDEFSVDGNLTIRDVTKPVKLKAEFGGIAKDPYGNIKAGFTVEGKINRKDFGLTWNAATEAGGVMVGEDLKIHSEIQLVKQP
ncbi:MAG: polyisoprenoid-binding protein [Bacteroidia bacterium]|nr:polyisoprenoid-binding protein [Bacteroidia bacterium]